MLNFSNLATYLYYVKCLFNLKSANPVCRKIHIWQKGRKEEEEKEEQRRKERRNKGGRKI